MIGSTSFCDISKDYPAGRRDFFVLTIIKRLPEMVKILLCS